MNITESGESGVGPSGHCDQRDPHTFNVRKHIAELLRLPRVGDGKHEVLRLNHSEVAVFGLGRMNEKGGRTG